MSRGEKNAMQSNNVDVKSTDVMRVQCIGFPAVLIFSDFLKYADC